MRLFCLLASIAITSSLLFATACTGDPSGSGEPALTAPTLTFPADGAVEVSTQSTLSWRASRGSGVKYKVDISADDGMAWTTLTSATSSTSYTIVPSQELQTSTGYMWRVTAFTDTAQEASPERSFTTANMPTPALTSPIDNSNVIAPPTLYWSFNAPDGMDVTFSVNVSTNGTSWTTKASGLTVKNYTFADAVAGTKYWWQVVATSGADQSASGVYRFGYAVAYSDGEYRLYKDSNIPGYNPFVIIVTGDGYVAADYDNGGLFDQKADAMMDAFFQIEPYKTYKDYFKVYKLAAISTDSGVSVAGYRPEDPSKGRPSIPAQVKNTVFGCILSAGDKTLIEGNDNAIWTYAYKIPGITSATIGETAVFVMVNMNSWSGSCNMWTDGRCIAKTAMDSNAAARNIHEGGGHGIPKLADEYINYAGPIPAKIASDAIYYRKGDPWSWVGNVAFTSNRDEVHWKHYFTEKPEYDVSVIEGAYYYKYDVWRASSQSIMQGSASIDWFNAPSRESIVRRIMSVAGKTFNYTDFYANDVDTKPSGVRSQYYGVSMPHDPPVVMDENNNVIPF